MNFRLQPLIFGMHRFKAFFVYAFTMFFNAAASFATFSLLTHHLNEVDYGIINLYNAFLIFLSPFISAGVHYSLSIDYFKLGTHQYKFHFTNSLAIPITLTVLFSCIFVAFHGIIERFTQIDFLYVALLPAACFGALLYDIMLNMIRNKEKYFLYAGFTISKNLIEIGVTILLVVVIGMNWKGRVASSLIASAVVLFVSVLLMKKWRLLVKMYDRQSVKKIFNTGLPFVPERLSIFILAYSDRFFINYYEGTADVGLYSAGAQIAIIVSLLMLTLNNVFQPGLFKELAKPKIDYAFVRRQCLSFLALSFAITMAVLLSIPIIFNLFIGKTFHAGQPYAVNLTIANFFWSIYCLFLCFLLAIKKNRLIMLISIFAMVLSFGANFFSVRYFGAAGATYTTLGVYFFMAAVSLYFVNRLFGLKNIFNKHHSSSHVITHA